MHPCTEESREERVTYESRKSVRLIERLEEGKEVRVTFESQGGGFGRN